MPMEEERTGAQLHLFRMDDIPNTGQCSGLSDAGKGFAWLLGGCRGAVHQV